MKDVIINQVKASPFEQYRFVIADRAEAEQTRDYLRDSLKLYTILTNWGKYSTLDVTP